VSENSGYQWVEMSPLFPFVSFRFLLVFFLFLARSTAFGWATYDCDDDYNQYVMTIMSLH
jgi:hypothetical protein